MQSGLSLPFLLLLSLVPRYTHQYVLRDSSFALLVRGDYGSPSGILGSYPSRSSPIVDVVTICFAIYFTEEKHKNKKTRIQK